MILEQAKSFHTSPTEITYFINDTVIFTYYLNDDCVRADVGGCWRCGIPMADEKDEVSFNMFRKLVENGNK